MVSSLQSLLSSMASKQANKALHPNAIPLRSIAAGELEMTDDLIDNLRLFDEGYNWHLASAARV